MIRFADVVLIVIMALSGASSVFALSPACEVIVSMPDQHLAVVDRGKLIARYPISTSKLGSAMVPEVIAHRLAYCLFLENSATNYQPVQ